MKKLFVKEKLFCNKKERLLKNVNFFNTTSHHKCGTASLKNPQNLISVFYLI